MTAAQSLSFLKLNFNVLVLEDPNDAMTDKQILAIALMRLAFVRKGLISPSFTPARVYANHNEAES